MSDASLEKVRKYIEENSMFSNGEGILAGVSGGADSTCLLLMLVELRDILGIKLEVVHVNHHVRAEAGDDAEFVRHMCGRLDVPFILRDIDMEGYAKQNGLSSEEAGRILRYRIFNDIMDEDGLSKTAVAHNSNDRAETIIFNLMRGSGLKGMCGIEPVHGDIVRPLLCIDRNEIEQYLMRKHQDYVTDRTNLSDGYARNRIRHHILTYAEEKICPGAVRHINETADMLSETQMLIDELTDTAYSACVRPSGDGVEIDTARLGSENIVIRKAVILRCFERLTPHRKDITQIHVAQILNLTAADGSSRISLPYGLDARIEYGRLYIGRGSCDAVKDSEMIRIPEPPCSVAIPGTGTAEFTVEDNRYGKGDNILENKYTKFFDYDKISSCLLWRGRQAGDYLTMDDEMHRQSLKKYMINQKIPQNIRDSIYILADEDHVLWVPGYRISTYYKITAQTVKVLKVQLKNGGNYGGTY